jgi:hypothetical protein
MRIIKILAGFIALGVIGYLGFVAYLTLSPDIENFRHRTEFNSEIWKNWKETEVTACLRWDMTHDLTKHYELIGMSTEEVIELLGTPSNKTSSSFHYYLGMARHGIDTGSLILELENGKVLNYRIWHG